jgi:diaminopimelate decarboxylase/aspartate kinase
LSPVAPAAHKPWVVAKFGGTSVSTRPRWETIARIAAAHQARGRRVLVVVSALSGITDLLKRIAESRADTAACREAQVGIVERQHHVALRAAVRLHAQHHGTVAAHRA